MVDVLLAEENGADDDEVLMYDAAKDRRLKRML